MARSLLIISRQAPWSGPSAREALDIVLAGGAFELPLGLLFLLFVLGLSPLAWYRLITYWNPFVAGQIK